MNDTYEIVREELLGLNSSLSELLATLRKKKDIADRRFDDWYRTCRDIEKQINDDIVRVAVIGTIKSGKSTLVNSFFKGDYLKRGAGVVTSIVTRIRSGETLDARLVFKSWDEINADIRQSLVLMPMWEKRRDKTPFDIRNDKDRHALQWALDGLSGDMLVTDGTLNTNSVRLSLYLKGFDSVSDIVSGETGVVEFDHESFGEHRKFAGDDSLAVYLKDIELRISNEDLDYSIEVADCQGSDSPNPLHLAMIQDYLLKTHFIVYVISSRTGLRQADIRFLSMIKKMGILDNTIFVVNIDFNEHDSLSDLDSVVEKVREELSLIKPDPDLYAFSALFNLFNTLSDDLTRKDELKLSQWKEEEDIASCSDRETGRFLSTLKGKLISERFGLLFRNHIERMDVITSGMSRWVSTNRELLKKDLDGASESIKKMQNYQERILQIKKLVKSTLNGASDDLIRELKVDIDRFFNSYSGGVMEQASEFVRDYKLSVEKYRSKLETSGFSNTLYLIFQEFRQTLDSFMAESVNPEVARFSVEIEERIKDSLTSVIAPFQSMASDDIANLRASLSVPDLTGSIKRKIQHDLLDLNVLKNETGIELPSSAVALQYSAKVRAEAVMRLGLYSVSKLIKKALKKSGEDERKEQIRALSDGFELIREETGNSIHFHFENYRENFKFQYVDKLIKQSGKYLNQLLAERFESYSADIRALKNIVEKKGAGRKELTALLEKTLDDTQDIHGSIVQIREQVQKSQSQTAT